MRRFRFLALAPLLVPCVAFAQTLLPDSGSLSGGSCNFKTGELGFECLPIYIGYLVQVLAGGIGTMSVIQIIYAGYQLAFSGISGDKTAGKNRLTWALIGLIASILAFAIMDYVVGKITQAS